MTAQSILPGSPAHPYVHPRLSHERWVAFGVAVLVHATALFIVKPATPPAFAPSLPADTKQDPPPITDDILEMEQTPAPVDRLPRPDVIAPPRQPEVILAAPLDLPRQLPDVTPHRRGEANLPTIPTSFGPPADGPGPGIFNPASLDRLPQLVSRVAPVFPAGLKSEVQTGTVRITFVVDTDGRVSDIRILQSSHRGFEEAVERAVSRWRFKAGWKNGRAVATRMEQEIVFTLTD